MVLGRILTNTKSESLKWICVLHVQIVKHSSCNENINANNKEEIESIQDVKNNS